MVDVSVLSALTQVPIGFLTPALDGNGPYGAGNHVLDTWSDAGTTRNVSDTFGLLVMPNGAIAPKLGRTIGFDDGGVVDMEKFEDRIVQVVALHQALSGAWLPTQVHEVFYAPWLTRWFEALPGRIGLYVHPSWSIDLFYLKTI